MSRWLDRVDDLLYDGEHVASSFDVGEGGVVITSHRLLAFTPDGEGANYRYVDRPNVVGVERTTRGSGTFLTPAVKALVVGAILLIAGQVVSLDDMVGTVEIESTGAMGLGGFFGLMQSLLTAVAMLDELMTLLGALVLLVAVALLGLYARTRTDLLVVEVAGEDDLELPAGPDDGDVADRLDLAVRPDAPTEGDGGTGSGGDPPA